MNYIEESHRNLLTKKGPRTSDKAAQKVVQQRKLPQLSQRGSMSPKNDMSQDLAFQVSSQIRNRAICSITEESHEDALREIDRLMKKNKSLEDELSIVTAKKMSFKSQALRNQKELKKMAETLTTIQKEMNLQKENSAYQTDLSKDALEEMEEMRDTHVREIKLLQRGLRARTDDSQKNRVNEIADMVDSLGRAALQRDRVTEQNQKLLQRERQANREIKTFQEERRKYLGQNNRLTAQFQELKRANNLLMKVSDKSYANIEPDLSEEEFEEELSNFEKRYAILDEGARGLDHWVEKLHREQGRVEKKSVDSSRDMASLEKALNQWQDLNEQKDAKIDILAGHLKEMKEQFGAMQIQINNKSQELQVKLDEERRRYETKLKQLQTEVEYARSTAQGYQALTEKLQDELVRSARGMHATNSARAHHQAIRNSPYEYESNDGMEGREYYEEKGKASSEEYTSPLPLGDDTEDVPTDLEVAQLMLYSIYMKEYGTDERGGRGDEDFEVLAQQAQFVKTGELLQLEVRQVQDTIVLYGHELSTNERYTVPLDSDLVDELDQEDPWNELFTVVGITLGPPKNLVLPSLIGRREVPLAPSGVWMILTVYKYESQRYFLNGFDPQSQRLVDLVVIEDSFTEGACQIINSISDNEVLFDFFLGRLQLFESPPDADEDEPPKLRLVFSADV